MKGESEGDLKKQGGEGGGDGWKATEDGLGCGGVTHCQESGRMWRR